MKVKVGVEYDFASGTATIPLTAKNRTYMVVTSGIISSRRGLASTQESTAARLGGRVNKVDIRNEIISMLK